MQLGKAIVRRREFVTLLGGAAAWSSIADAQQPQTGLSLIGVLWPWKSPSPILLSYSKALSEGLQEEGYTEGRNITTESRYYENLDGLKKAAAELVALNVNGYSCCGWHSGGDSRDARDEEHSHRRCKHG